AVDDDVRPQPAEIMVQVEGEAVVVVDQDDHSRPFSRPLAHVGWVERSETQRLEARQAIVGSPLVQPGVAPTYGLKALDGVFAGIKAEWPAGQSAGKSAGGLQPSARAGPMGADFVVARPDPGASAIEGFERCAR